MPNFLFRYAAPLKQAALAEQDQQRALATLLRKQHIFETQLRGMQQTINDAKQQLGQKLVGSVDLAALGSIARFTGDSRIRGQQIVQKLALLNQQITHARAELNQRTQRRRSFELLRDRDLADFKRRQKRKEIAAIDEVAARNHPAPASLASHLHEAQA